MKKQNSQMLGDYALLANFAYAEIDQTFKNNQLQTDNIVNILMTRNEGMSGSIKGNVTRSQAEHIASNYNIIAHWKDGFMGYGFSGTLFRNKNSNEYVLALRGSNPADFPSNIADIGVQGVNYEQVVDLYNFTKLLTSNNKGYTAVKLTEDVKLNQMISELKQIELIIKHAIDTPENRERYNQLLKEIEKEKSKSIDGQLINKDTADNIFLDEISRIRLPEGVKIPEGTKFTVVGHSLGGHLAMSFARLFPELTNHAYSFNGAGFGNFSGNEVDKFFNLLLDKESSFNPEILSSIISYKGREFTAMDDGHLKQVISPHYVFTNESAHGIKELVDSMSAISFIATLDKRFADLSLSEIFEPEGKEIEKNQTNAKPITKILESLSYDDNQFFGLFVQKMFRILKGKDYTGDLGHDKFHQTLFDLKDDLSKNIGFEKGSFTISAVHDITDFVAKALSPEGYAYRYALKHLNSFVIEHEKLYAEDGVLKDELSSLKLYDPNDINTEEGMTVEYIINRAKMIYENISNILNEDYIMNKNILYNDMESDIYNVILDKPFSYTKEIVNKLVLFSGSAKDYIPYHLLPISYNQITVFAGAGDDNIKGTKNGDYFEGGTGFDTYHVEGYDIIHDVDGKGKITGSNMDEHFFLISLGVWETKDGKHIGIQDGLDLEIKEKDNEKNRFTIHNFFNPKFDQGDAFVHLNIRVEKEPERPLLEYEEPKHEKEHGAMEKNNSFFNHGEYVAYQGGNKTDRVTSSKNQGMIASLGKGSDIFIGNEKKDIAFGDDDNDIVIGANKNEEKMEDPDYIEGGKGKDLIYGGGGDDVLYAHSTEIKYGSFVYEQTDFSESFKFSDIVIGGFGDDKIFGSAGRDILAGGGHKDIIFGGAGADLILGDTQFLFNYKYNNVFVDGDKPSTNEYHYSKDLKDWVINPHFNSGYFIFEIKEESFDWSFDVSGYDQEKTNYEIITKVPLKEKLELDSKGDTDYLYGGKGEDLMLGQKGNDFMFGQDGDDIMFGDDNKDLSISGDDYMSGGDGNNQLYGGKGNDTYVIHNRSYLMTDLGYLFFYNKNYNLIYDSEGNDTVDLSEFFMSNLDFHLDNNGNLGVIDNTVGSYLVHVKNFISNPIENWIFKDGHKNHHEIQEYSYKNDFLPPILPIEPDVYV